MATVVLTGATGRVGTRLLPLLCEQGHRVLAVTRRAEAKEDLAALGAEPVVGDINAPASLDSAFSQADTVFLATADAPDQDRIETGLISAIAKAGSPHVVKLSAQSAGLSPPRSFGIYHRRAEQALEASGLPWTILRPTFFQQSLLLFAADIAAKGKLIAPAGTGKIAMVDLEDVARSAATVLGDTVRGDTGYAGRIYTLTGPSAHSLAEVTAALSDRLGRKIGYVSPPAFVARLVLPFATGMPRWQSNLVVDLFSALKAGAQEQVSGDVETLSGQPPSSLNAFLQRHIDAFRP